MSRNAIDHEPAVRVKRLFSLMEIIFRWLVVWKASLLKEEVAFTVKLSLIESAIHLTIDENNK